MATRSSIAMLNLDGTVHAHYCHSSGYISYNGQILYEHYQDVNKVKELIALGDMSSLAEEVSSPDGSPNGSACYFYGRDGGEDNTDTQKYASLEDYMVNGNFQEYDYIFKEKNKTWYLIDHKKQKLQKLTGFLIKDEEVSPRVKQMINNQKIAENNEKMAKKLNKELGKKDLSVGKFKI